MFRSNASDIYGLSSSSAIAQRISMQILYRGTEAAFVPLLPNLYLIMSSTQVAFFWQLHNRQIFLWTLPYNGKIFSCLSVKAD